MSVNPDPPIRCLQYLGEIRLELGGVVRAVLDLCSALAEGGVEVTILTHDASDIPTNWATGVGPTIRVITIDRLALGGFFMPAEQKRAIEKLIAEHDVVHMHTPWAVPNYLLARSATKQNKPYLITLHGMLDDWCMTQSALKKRIYLRLFGKRMLEYAAYVHCTASDELAQSQKWYPAGKPRVIPCVVDLSPYDPAPNPNQALAEFDYMSMEGVKLLFLSRIHVKKGLQHLIRACGELKRRGIPFQLGIAGPGEDRYVQQMRQLAQEQGVAESCHFLGMIKGDLKLSLYAASDLFVMPTSQENFGLVFPESLLCGTPVVTTRGVDIWKELAEAGGKIIEPTPAQLADTIESYAGRSLTERQDLSRQGRRYVQDWLDPTRLCASYKSAYRDAIAKVAQ